MFPHVVLILTLYGERSEIILVHGEIDNPAIAGNGEGHDDAMQKNIPLNKPKWPTLLRTVNFRPGPNDFKRTGATAAPANAIVAPANTIQQQASVERSNLSAVVENKVKYEVKLVIHAILLICSKWISAKRNLRDKNLKRDEIQEIMCEKHYSNAEPLKKRNL